MLTLSSALNNMMEVSQHSGGSDEDDDDSVGTIKSETLDDPQETNYSPAGRNRCHRAPSSDEAPSRSSSCLGGAVMHAPLNVPQQLSPDSLLNGGGLMSGSLPANLLHQFRFPASLGLKEEGSSPPGSGSGVVRTRRRKAAISEEERVCVVCGETASGYNFDRLTCESCKAFFRRNALKPREKIKACTRGGGCSVAGSQRKHCPSCRLEKCFATGMKKELILPPEKLEQRAKPRRRKHLSDEELGSGSMGNLGGGGGSGPGATTSLLPLSSDYLSGSAGRHHRVQAPSPLPPAPHHHPYLGGPTMATHHRQVGGPSVTASEFSHLAEAAAAGQHLSQHQHHSASHAHANALQMMRSRDQSQPPPGTHLEHQIRQMAALGPGVLPGRAPRGLGPVAGGTGPNHCLPSSPAAPYHHSASGSPCFPSPEMCRRAMMVAMEQQQRLGSVQGQGQTTPLTLPGPTPPARHGVSANFTGGSVLDSSGVDPQSLPHAAPNPSQSERNSSSEANSRCLPLSDEHLLMGLGDCVQRLREPFTPEEQLETGSAETLEQAYNRMDTCIRRIIRIVKILPYFGDIDKQTQLQLLRANIYGLIVLYTSSFFVKELNKLRYPVRLHTGSLTHVLVSMLDNISHPVTTTGTGNTRGVSGPSSSASFSGPPSSSAGSSTGYSPTTGTTLPATRYHSDSGSPQEGGGEGEEAGRQASLPWQQNRSSVIHEDFELYKENTLAAFIQLQELAGDDDYIRVGMLAIKLFAEDSLPSGMRPVVSSVRAAYLAFLWRYLANNRLSGHNPDTIAHLYSRILIAFIDIRTLEIRMTEFAKLLSLDGLSPLMREVCSHRAQAQQQQQQGSAVVPD